MNIAIIFAGGTGSRMGPTSVPKQFLTVHGKPIIIHVIEKFSLHPDIDEIIISCKSDYIELLKNLLLKFSIRKNILIVPGGKTGQESIFAAISVAHDKYPENSIVLVNDGVRPFISYNLISEHIKTTKKFGNAISVCPVTETLCTVRRGVLEKVLNRSLCFTAKAPQTFILKDLYEAHLWALNKGVNGITDSATLMHMRGVELRAVKSDSTNIKITTPVDFYMMRALLSMEEDSQLSKL